MNQNTTIDLIDEKQKDYTIALPCSTDDFGEFISSLLGKPQTISGMERGAFEISKGDIENSYHLVTQRIQQQNDAKLIQFTVRLVFDDNSSVLLNSLQDFNAYVEVRPIVVTQAHLSWSFIVKFPDRDHPEKQEIDLSFLTKAQGALSVGEGDGTPMIPIVRIINGGHIVFRIRHTARTWGADIEGLLRGHAQHLILPQTATRAFVQKHSGKIALVVALLFFVGTIAACLLMANNIAESQLNTIKDLLSTSNAIDQKLNQILKLISEGYWGRYFFSVSVFLIFSFIASIALAIWTESTADTTRPSHILLTKKSEQHKKEQDAHYSNKWWSFVGSIVTSIITGIAANIIFTSYWAP